MKSRVADHEHEEAAVLLMRADVGENERLRGIDPYLALYFGLGLGGSSYFPCEVERPYRNQDGDDCEGFGHTGKVPTLCALKVALVL